MTRTLIAHLPTRTRVATMPMLVWNNWRAMERCLTRRPASLPAFRARLRLSPHGCCGARPARLPTPSVRNRSSRLSRASNAVAGKNSASATIPATTPEAIVSPADTQPILLANVAATIGTSFGRNEPRPGSLGCLATQNEVADDPGQDPADPGSGESERLEQSGVQR